MVEVKYLQVMPDLWQDIIKQINYECEVWENVRKIFPKTET